MVGTKPLKEQVIISWFHTLSSNLLEEMATANAAAGEQLVHCKNLLVSK